MLSELKAQALSSQLNPHLIYNVLNSIQGLIAEGKEEGANIYISRFANFMRSTLKVSQDLKIPLEEEILLVEQYIELEKLRFGSKVQFELNMNASLGELFVPPLITQPLLENAIKHGVMPMNSNSKKISISFSEENGSLRIEVEDNGMGFEKDIDQVMNEGLRITRDRIRSLDLKNSLTIESLANPTRIVLKIMQ